MVKKGLLILLNSDDNLVLLARLNNKIAKKTVVIR